MLGQEMSVIMLLCCCGILQVLVGQVGARSFTIDYERDTYLKDGEPFRYISGSIHYNRVPRIYWTDRLLKMLAAGLNTIETYVPWNFHQQKPFQSDFTGNLDLVAFLKLAQDLGFLVLLRPGPFTCAGWDYGGLPAWLMESQFVNKNITVRTNNAVYMGTVESWFADLLPRVRPLLYSNGGPIIAIQIENEYGSYSCDHDYIHHLHDIVRSHLGPDIVLFTVDGANAKELKCGTVEELYATVDFGLTDSPEKQFSIQRMFEPHGPLVCTEFYVETGIDYWGWNHTLQNPHSAAKSLDLLLAYGANVNMYMFEGGTNFGFSSGSQDTGKEFRASTTSYDHDAPLSEAGDVREKYHTIRDVVLKYVKSPTIPIPSDTPKAAYGHVKMNLVGSIMDVLTSVSPRPVKSVHPLCMEDIHQYYGFALYHHVAEKYYINQELNADGVRDRAYIIVNSVTQGIVIRDKKMRFNITLYKGDNLDILVENLGRTYSGGSHQQKGIIQNVTVGGITLLHWTMFPLNLENISSHLSSDLQTQPRFPPSGYQMVPSLYTGTFTIPVSLSQPLDTYIDMRPWHKGQVYINGYNVGRYWPSLGPQVTLYVPKSFLKPRPALNTVVAFETDYSPCDDHYLCFVNFVDKPFINKTVV